jgi:hypothetical protein
VNKDEIIRMAREAGLADACWESEISFLLLKRFAAIVAAAEREECATLCDGVAGAAKINTAVLPESHHRMVAADDCADLIRARGRG